MRTIKVQTAKPYDVVVGSDLFPYLGEQIKTLLAGASKLLVVTDANVGPLYLEKLSESLRENGAEVFSVTLPAGEQHKNFTSLQEIVTTAAKHAFCRDDAFLALGGGVVGDMTGFAASVYMRGIRYVQIPTTLLAGIDASIGGKTAIDLPEGKNLVGAFYQPEGVFFDTDTLRTLPKAEIKNGLGEGLKYAVLCGGRIKDILLNDELSACLEEFCALCAEYKAELVSRDEKEGGIRALLNLGHTPGHAIEILSGYTVPHGKAVAMGIDIMAKASLNNGVLPISDYETVQTLLAALGFDEKVPFSREQIALSAKTDKKKRTNGINVLEIVRIGDCRIRKMTLKEYEDYIR